jgi:hypothetical protein
MPEPAVTDFERRLIDALAAHAAAAIDHRPTSQVAAEAMRIAGRRPRIVPWQRGRLLAIAAVLLLPLALALGLAGAALLRPAQAADDIRAVVARKVGDGLDIILARPDGQERVLRHLTGESLGLGPGYTFEEGGSLGPDGWLTVFIDMAGKQDYHFSKTAFVSLTDPATAPVIVASNGFVGPRWGPGGEAALVCGPDCGSPSGMSDRVRVLDLDQGTESFVTGVQLQDGTPEPIWAADGSGFLYHFQTLGWGVTPLDGGPVVQGLPGILSRRWRLASGTLRGQLIDAMTVGKSWLGESLAPAVPVAAQNAADGEAIWVLLDQSDGDLYEAVLAKVTGPDEIALVRRFDVPMTVTGALRLSDDDAHAALGLGSDAPWPFVVVPLVGGDDTPTNTGPPVDGLLLGLVPAAADAWPSEPIPGRDPAQTPTEAPSMPARPLVTPLATATVLASALALSGTPALAVHDQSSVPSPGVPAGWLVMVRFGQAPDGSTTELDFGRRQIWLVRPDGSDLHELAPGAPAEGKSSPDVSPDGTRIAFSSWHEPVLVYTVDVGGRDAQVTSGDCAGLEDECLEFDPAWSPDGTKLAVVRHEMRDGAGSSWIAIRDLSTGERTDLESTRVDSADGWLAQPTWSPDGTRMAYHRTPTVEDGYPAGISGWIVDLTGGDPVQLVTPDGEDAADLDWSPDGERLLYSTIGFREFEGRQTPGARIVSIRPDGSDPIVVCNGRAAGDLPGDDGCWAPSWLPDGQQVLFYGYQTWNLVGADGTGNAPIDSMNLHWFGNGPRQGYGYQAVWLPGQR